MKTAIYIEDGRTQLVLTPESEYEKQAVYGFQEKSMEVRIKKGGFYACQGGWTRHETDSVIIVMDEKKKLINNAEDLEQFNKDMGVEDE